MVKGSDRQEPRKSREVSGRPLGPDLLAQVEPYVALEYRAPLARDPDQRDGSYVEGSIEIEVVAKLGRGQGMHGLVQRSASEQVDADCLELSRTRSEQGEVETPILNAPVHFVEEDGKALDPVDYHRAAWWRRLEIRSEEGRIGELVLVASLVEETDVPRVGKLQPRPGALAHPANAKKEKAQVGQPGQSGKVVSAMLSSFFEEYCRRHGRRVPAIQP